jgi:hypothetical protein
MLPMNTDDHLDRSMQHIFDVTDEHVEKHRVYLLIARLCRLLLFAHFHCLCTLLLVEIENLTWMVGMHLTSLCKIRDY